MKIMTEDCSPPTRSNGNDITRRSIGTMGSRRRPTAISTALRSFDQSHHSSLASRAEPVYTGIRYFVAATRSLRQKAYRFAHDAYVAKGLVESASSGMVVNRHDRRPDTLTILAQNAAGESAGTVTLVFDAPDGLPGDAVFEKNFDALRTQGRRMAEVTRLALNPKFAHDRMLLVRLFNLIYIGARRVMGSTDFLIEVNPRHASYYRRLLGFERVSEVRACPRVRGEPAVLLRLDLAVAEREIAALANTKQQRSPSSMRSLYSYFLPEGSESTLAANIRSQRRPMNESDAEFFGLL